MEDVIDRHSSHRTSVHTVGPIAIQDSSGVGEARRVAQGVAHSVNLSTEDEGRLAIVVTELATNQIKHAKDGVMFFHPLTGPDGSGVLLIASDRGRGMDVQSALRDGHSSVGTAGNGLGAIQRMSDEADFHSIRGRGTVVVARVGPDSSRVSASGVAMPLAGETMCGDAWAVSQSGGYRTALVVDGLGHGPLAAEAARVAVDGFLKHAAAPIEMILRVLHGLLRPTRGAAVAIARVDQRDASLRFGGVGNISGTIFDTSQSRSLISHNGTLGHQASRFQEFAYPWSDDSVLVLHSDGLTSQWRLDDTPALRGRHPALIAAVLVRDHARGRDDATAFVLKNSGGPQ